MLSLSQVEEKMKSAVDSARQYHDYFAVLKNSYPILNSLFLNIAADRIIIIRSAAMCTSLSCVIAIIAITQDKLVHLTFLKIAEISQSCTLE